MNKKLLQLYGLKFNPFSPELPTGALRTTPIVESFLWKLEHTLAREAASRLLQVSLAPERASAFGL